MGDNKKRVHGKHGKKTDGALRTTYPAISCFFARFSRGHFHKPLSISG